MQRCARIAVLGISMLLLVLGATASPAAARTSPVQLSLGDSWAFGFGAAVPSEGGYVPQLHEALQEQYNCSPGKTDNGHCKKLELVTVAVGGATTPTLIANQLPTAVSLLQNRNSDANPRNDVEVVTISIGGNDVFGPIVGACSGGINQNCLQVITTEFAAYRSDLNAALSALREAAGPDARIVIGTYDNGIATCYLSTVPGGVQIAALVLEGAPPFIPAGLHDVIRDVADDYGVEVAEVYGDLAPQDWVGGDDCLHPNDTGYDKVTDAFLEVLLAG